MQETENKREDTKRVDLDTILVNEIGQFGWYQLRTVGLSALVVLFLGWNASEYIFTTARINTRCFIPECETRDTVVFSPEWVFNAIPASGNSFDNCQRYANITTVSHPDDTCPKDLFNRANLIFCEEFVYENTHSVVYDYDLACDEWRRTFIGSIRNAGNLVALPFVGYVSDRWGRRVLITVSAVNTAVLGVVRYWANTYVGFFLSQVAEATLGTGGFSSAYILLMEIVGPKYRVAAGATMNTFFALGQVTLGLIVWAVPNWRKLTLTIYIPQFITISYFWILSESIRWYLSKGRYLDAEKILRKAAHVNGKQLSNECLEALRLTVEEEKLKAERAAHIDEPWLVVQVFRDKRIFTRTIVSPICWITMTLVYYGLSINSVNISGNMYLNYVAVSAVEIPGYWVAVALMERIGRKPVLMAAYWICAACQIAYIFMPDGLFGASLAVYLIGKCCISMVITTLYVYTAELYPTKYRHRLFAFSSMVGRLGSITAPLTPAMGAALWDDFPYALFAGFALVSGFLVLITPETLGTKLPDTMEEASQMGTKSTNLYENNK